MGRPSIVTFLESAAAMGGVERTTLDLVENLDRARWEPVVICPEEGELPEACRRAGVDVRILPRPAMYSTSFWIGESRKLPNPFAWAWDIGALLGAARRVARLLALERPDVVVTKGLFSHLCGGFAAKKLGIPCLWHAQDFISGRFAGVYVRVFGQLASWLPSHIVVIGPQIARQLPERLRRRVSIVYNAVDDHLYGATSDGSSARNELGIEPGALVIGNVGRLTPWKGQRHLLEAFAQFARDEPRARLLFVGGSLFDSGAYERRLRARASDLGLSHAVVFTGHRSDVPRMLAAMDLFAYCAVEKDICPLSLLSAMAVGLPIVAFDIEGVREAMVADEHGLLVPVAQAQPLARALGRLASDDGLRCRLGRNARARVQERFTLAQHVRHMDEILQGLTGKHRPYDAKNPQSAGTHPSDSHS